MGYIDDVSKLSYGVKDNELDFVSYSEETLGNAVGIALGKSMSDKSNKPIWCNISDGALLMGPTMEAFANYQKISSLIKRPLLITIDFNKSFAKSTSHLNAYELQEWLQNLGWDANVTSSDYNDHPRFINSLFDQSLELLNTGKTKALVLIIRTIKGQGVEELEQLSQQLHYNIMTEAEVEKLTIKSYEVHE
jgi:transketolase N-terminal domain/subunit